MITLPNRLPVFSTEQEKFGWLELGKNEVVVTYLKDTFQMKEDTLRQFFSSNQDARDLAKAKVYGAWLLAKDILDNIELAKSSTTQKFTFNKLESYE